MNEILKSAKMDFCQDLEIIFPSLTKEELGTIIKFLYHGQIVCDAKISTSEIIHILTNIFGFPSSMDFSAESSTSAMNYDTEVNISP